MSKLSAQLEEAWKFMDWDRIINSIYLMIKEEDKLEARNAELEEQHDMDVERMRIIDNKNHELEAKLKVYEGGAIINERPNN